VDTYYVGDNPQYTLIIDNRYVCVCVSACVCLSVCVYALLPRYIICTTYYIISYFPYSGVGKSGSNKGSMWILFSRHLTVKQQTESNSSEGDADDSDYFAVHVFKGTGERIYAPNPNPTIKGIYNNDPHTLIRFDTGDLPGKCVVLCYALL
jgi:hypothetical protein